MPTLTITSEPLVEAIVRQFRDSVNLSFAGRPSHGLAFTRNCTRQLAKVKSKTFQPRNEASLNFVPLRSSAPLCEVERAVKGRDERPKKGRP